MRRRMMWLCLGAILAAPTSTPVADEHRHGTHERMATTTLSASDVDDLLAGRGWGLAKPAERGGYPGPVHVLELRQELALTPAQITAIEEIFKRMQFAASDLGRAYVEAEQALDTVFSGGAATADAMAKGIAEAERLRAGLRQVHLEAHLQTRPLLTERQVAAYRRLRGYGHEGPGHHAH